MTQGKWCDRTSLVSETRTAQKFIDAVADSAGAHALSAPVLPRADHERISWTTYSSNPAVLQQGLVHIVRQQNRLGLRGGPFALDRHPGFSPLPGEIALVCTHNFDFRESAAQHQQDDCGIAPRPLIVAGENRE